MAKRGLVQVDGARELRKTLKSAGEDLTELKDTHREVADIVNTRALGAVPRRTGTLAASMRTGATQTSATIRAGRKRIPYAGPIHYGWPARGIEPQPWITEAAHDTEPIWTERFKAAVDQILAKIKGA